MREPSEQNGPRPWARLDWDLNDGAGPPSDHDGPEDEEATLRGDQATLCEGNGHWGRASQAQPASADEEQHSRRPHHYQRVPSGGDWSAHPPETDAKALQGHPGQTVAPWEGRVPSDSEHPISEEYARTASYYSRHREPPGPREHAYHTPDEFKRPCNPDESWPNAPGKALPRVAAGKDRQGGEPDPKLILTALDGIQSVQVILDENRGLISEINQNLAIHSPRELANNVPLLQQLNNNTHEVYRLYEEMSKAFEMAGRAGQKRRRA